MGKGLIVCLFLAMAAGCKPKTAEETEFQPNECRKWPDFATRIGYPARVSAFNTSYKKVMGLVLAPMNAPDTGKLNFYQHPSWKKAGWLAAIQLDNYGNLFAVPAPHVNVFDNRLEDQNTIYKVAAETGEMNVFTRLPQPEANDNQNAYGLMGLCFYCEKELLYASSVAGSTREKERGAIYCIDAQSGKVKDKLTGFDPFGIGICYIEGKRRLYFGKARNSDIYAIDLTASGKFAGSPQLVASIANMGPRGDDKAKKISFTPKGDMLVEGFEFNFNLIAPVEKQTARYFFRYSPNAEQWQPIGEGQVR